MQGNGSGGISIYTGTDRKLKDNIVDIPDALQTISNLKPRRFNFKLNPEEKYEYGFIADEYKTVFPDKVTTFDKGESTEHEAISVDHLVGIMAKAIQELTAKVEALEARLGD